MSDEKPVKRVARKPDAVPVKEPEPLPPIDIAESMKVVLEALEYAKPKEKEDGPEVITGHRF